MTRKSEMYNSIPCPILVYYEQHDTKFYLSKSTILPDNMIIYTLFIQAWLCVKLYSSALFRDVRFLW